MQGSAVCRVTRTTLWTQGEELVSLAPCRDHLAPGPWSLQGRTCGYSLLYLQLVLQVLHQFKSCVKAQIISTVDVSVSHRSLTVAHLTFYLTGPVTPSSSPAPALAALYPVAAVCSVAGSSYCHAPSAAPPLSSPAPSAAPPLCHQTTWSSLAPDPKSEFPAHLHSSQHSA